MEAVCCTHLIVVVVVGAAGAAEQQRPPQGAAQQPHVQTHRARRTLPPNERARPDWQSQTSPHFGTVTNIHLYVYLHISYLYALRLRHTSCIHAYHTYVYYCRRDLTLFQLHMWFENQLNQINFYQMQIFRKSIERLGVFNNQLFFANVIFSQHLAKI